MVDAVTGQDTPVDFSGVTRTEKEERYIHIKRDSNWHLWVVHVLKINEYSLHSIAC